MYYYSFCLNFVRSFLCGWGKMRSLRSRISRPHPPSPTPRRRHTPTSPLCIEQHTAPASRVLSDAAAPFCVRPLLFGQSGCRHYSGCKQPRCAR